MMPAQVSLLGTACTEATPGVEATPAKKKHVSVHCCVYPRCREGSGNETTGHPGDIPGTGHQGLPGRLRIGGRSHSPTIVQLSTWRVGLKCSLRVPSNSVPSNGQVCMLNPTRGRHTPAHGPQGNPRRFTTKGPGPRRMPVGPTRQGPRFFEGVSDQDH